MINMIRLYSILETFVRFQCTHIGVLRNATKLIRISNSRSLFVFLAKILNFQLSVIILIELDVLCLSIFEKIYQHSFFPFLDISIGHIGMSNANNLPLKLIIRREMRLLFEVIINEGIISKKDVSSHDTSFFPMILFYLTDVGRPLEVFRMTCLFAISKSSFYCL